MRRLARTTTRRAFRADIELSGTRLCVWGRGGLRGGISGGTPGEITYLAWNRKVQHILASTSANGTTVVWDLKRQRPVISFNDPNLRARNSCIQWNPEVATQLIVASDDDRKPMLQVCVCV
jgi:protein transport protein SEC31